MPASEVQPAPNLPTFPANGLERLARHVLEGDVVFFIGAGFSLESEWNSAARFIRRLLIRLEAMGRVLRGPAEDIRKRLRSTFDLTHTNPTPEASFSYTKQEVEELARRYYETNDWFCTAFAELLEIVAKIPETERADRLAKIHAEEESIRTKPGPPGTKALDEVPLDGASFPTLIRWVSAARQAKPPDVGAIRAAGKALFLDTMGFQNLEIMAGDPGEPLTQRVAEGFGNRLLPRHHVIARLARDGLCSTTLTTNFDLLLDGAYRVAGFRDRFLEATEVLPATHFSLYARITSPPEFFKEGKAHRTAVLVKMHGCTHTYRRVAQLPDPALPGPALLESFKPLESYLRSMVFTYREIQNWRDDAWAADFLRTLLRTRTVVFAGYSLQDPVVHDTFRTVYEEMARIRKGEVCPEAPPPRIEENRRAARDDSTAGDAPAFFFDVIDTKSAEKTPFHAIEVLKAASDAVGVPGGAFGVHDNFLRFHSRGSGMFPNIDEVYRWLFHLVLRYRQEECLRDDLRRTLTSLHGEGRPDDEVRRVEGLFGELFRSELQAARSWDDRATTSSKARAHRREMGRIVSWSESFHPGLLREFGIVDQLRRKGGFRLRLAETRRRGWYYPIMQNAAWTCWTAVVELALRRMIDAVGLSRIPSPDPRPVWAAAAELPTVLFLNPRASPVPDSSPAAAKGPFPILHALSIRFGGFDRIQPPGPIHGHPSSSCVWVMTGNDAPWRSTEWRIRDLPGRHQRSREVLEPENETGEHHSLATIVRRPPPAFTLWRWASRTETRADRAAAPLWLGLPPSLPCTPPPPPS